MWVLVFHLLASTDTAATFTLDAGYTTQGQCEAARSRMSVWHPDGTLVVGECRAAEDDETTAP